jgi:hypothetical protein
MNPKGERRRRVEWIDEDDTHRERVRSTSTDDELMA